MMVKVLQIPRTATIYFQKQDLTSEECLLHWREVMFKLEKPDNNSTSALEPPCNRAKNFYCGKRLSWQLFG